MSDETTNEGIAGVGLLIAAYVDERGANNAYDQLKQAKKSGEFYFDDAAIIRNSAKGKIHIDEKGDMSTGKGAGIGALIGGVVGILAGPVGWAVVGGAAIGAIAAHHDAGFSKESLKEIGAALPPGTSALAVTTSKDFIEAVRKADTEGETLTFAKDIAAEINGQLSLRQDVLMGLVITEEGVAATKVVSSPTAVSVFGIAATEDGVVAEHVVATADGVAYEIAAETDEGAAYEAGVITEDGAVIVDAVALPEEASEEETPEEAPKEDTPEE